MQIAVQMLRAPVSILFAQATAFLGEQAPEHSKSGCSRRAILPEAPPEASSSFCSAQKTKPV